MNHDREKENREEKRNKEGRRERFDLHFLLLHVFLPFWKPTKSLKNTLNIISNNNHQI